MKLGSWLGMVAALTLPLLGAATAPGLTQDDSQQANCANPVTTLDMGLCSGQKAEAADRKLNHVYQQLRQKLSGQQRQGLTSAQQAWIKFRDATCAYESSRFDGGTFAPVARASCLARVTQQRIQDLEKYWQDVSSQ